MTSPNLSSQFHYGASACNQSLSLPRSVGLGLKSEHFSTILETSPTLGFFEIHAENYMVDGGAFHHYLTLIRDRYPLSIHGVGLSIGGNSPLNQPHLERLKNLIDRYQPASFSEHLAWSTHHTTFLNDLLPLPYTTETLQRVCEHIDYAQNYLQHRLLLENPATYVEFSASTQQETEFINTIISKTGCGLLLDINNAYVSSVNHNRDVRDYLFALNLEAIEEIHLAGFSQETDEFGNFLLIDSHCSTVNDNVLELYKDVISVIGPTATLIERDNNVPSFEILYAESQTVQRLLSTLSNAS